MTPYQDEMTSGFAIPRTPSALLDALAASQRDYEDAKTTSEKATQAESAAVANRKLLKRDIIKALRDAGMSDSRSDKEYVDDEAWKFNENDIAIAQDRKRSAAVDESIARQRMLTLRGAILPVTAVMLARLTNTKFDAEGVTQIVDAGMSSMDGDPALSSDPSVAHNA